MFDPLDRRNFVLAGAAAAGTAAIGATLSLAGETRPFASFLPPGVDPATSDCGAALHAASAWSAAANGTVQISGRLRLDHAVVLDHAGARFVFDDAEIRIRDDGRPARPAAPVFAETPIGLLVRADNVALLGTARFIGLGKPGRTGLHGIWFDECRALQIGSFRFETMAIGQMFMCCDGVQVADTSADLMYGTQNGGRQGAGSAQVIAGCRNAVFGKLRATRNDKPMRYLSPGVDRAGAPRDNTGNRYGLVEGTGRDGSPWAQGIAIRSSVDSSFAGARVSNVMAVLMVEKYDTDDRWDVRGNRFDLIAGDVIDSASSMDGGVMIDNLGKRPIGDIRIARLELQGPTPAALSPSQSLPQTFGLYVTDGSLTVDTARISGFTFQISAYDSALSIGTLVAERPGFEVFRYGRGLRGSIPRLDIRSGISGPVSNAGLIRAVDLGRRGIPPRFEIAEASFAAGSERQPVDYVQYDPLYAPDAMKIAKLVGQGRRGTRAFLAR